MIRFRKVSRNSVFYPLSYPYINDFYATIRSDAKVGSPERILFEWLQSEAGQALIAHEGYGLIED